MKNRGSKNMFIFIFIYKTLNVDTPPPPKLGFHDFHDTIKVARALYMYCSGVDSHQQTISALYSIYVQYSTLKTIQTKAAGPSRSYQLFKGIIIIKMSTVQEVWTSIMCRNSDFWS